MLLQNWLFQLIIPVDYQILANFAQNEVGNWAKKKNRNLEAGDQTRLSSTPPDEQ